MGGEVFALVWYISCYCFISIGLVFVNTRVFKYIVYIIFVASISMLAKSGQTHPFCGCGFVQDLLTAHVLPSSFWRMRRPGNCSRDNA